MRATKTAVLMADGTCWPLVSHPDTDYPYTLQHKLRYNPRLLTTSDYLAAADIIHAYEAIILTKPRQAAAYMRALRDAMKEYT